MKRQHRNKALQGARIGAGKVPLGVVRAVEPGGQTIR